jgi:hypothetical protein
MERRVSIEEITGHVSQRFGVDLAALEEPGEKRTGLLQTPVNNRLSRLARRSPLHERPWHAIGP